MPTPAILKAMTARYAYYDRDADIAWLPTGYSEDVLSEQVDWGLIDHDATTDEVVAIEVWYASTRLPQHPCSKRCPHPARHTAPRPEHAGYSSARPSGATQLGWVVTGACLLAGFCVPEFGCCYSA